MAHLGTLTVIDGDHPLPSSQTPITDYDVVRGKFLGVLTVIAKTYPLPELQIASGYVVRQIRIMYRQLWPSHGQRFPQ